ncbi:MAG: SpoIIE family protein phosphatase [Leptospiraceae bacterium]|nr:SpoIIE family protein phosphatase [Leptospiraceae bacterium]
MNINLYSFPVLELDGAHSRNALQVLEISTEFGKTPHLEEVANSTDDKWKKNPQQDLFYYPKENEHLWLRFELSNQFYDQLYFIRVREFGLDKVICYMLHEDGTISRLQGGISFPLKEKGILSVDSVFPIYLKNGEKAKIFLNIYADLISASFVTVHSTNGLLDYFVREHFFLGIYYGLIIFVVVLSLAIYVYLKDISYIYYLFFISFYGIFQFSRNSLAIYFLYPNNPEINLDVWYFFFILSMFSGCLFSRSFLNLKMFNPFLYRCFLYLAFSVLLLMPVPYLISVNVIYFVPIFGVSYILVLYSSAFYVYYKGFRPARYFILGWGFLISGAIVSVFTTKYNFITEYSSQLGSTLEMFLMTFAILSRSNKLRIEKDAISEEVSEYKKELDLAQKIQISLLPISKPKLKGCEISSYYLPMQQIGGDFYDYRVRGNSISCIVADVSGHGPAAALIASMVKVSFAATGEFHDKPSQALSKMNNSLYGNLGKNFVSCVYAYLDLDALELTYASGGHPPILIHRRSEGTIHRMESKGQLLGLFPQINITEHKQKLYHGDRILIYTDGILEAFNEKMEMFETENLFQALKENQNMSAEGFTFFLAYRLKEWVGFKKEFEDDITLIVADIT